MSRRFHPSRGRTSRRPAQFALGATGLALVFAAVACGGDDTGGSTATTADPATTTADPATTTGDPAADVVELVASDYAFGGLPDTVAPGTAFNLTNTSAAEIHELVMIRLPDAETRPVDALVHEDLAATLSAGPPALVMLAPPAGAEAIVAVGDGALHEPGRYLAICMIPTGADPMAYLDAAATSNGAPPSVPGGAPHAMQGMYGEITVA